MFLSYYLATLDWTRGSKGDYIVLALPLITAPIGTILCERLFRGKAVA